MANACRYGTSITAVMYEAQVGNLEILKNVGDGVFRKRAVVDAGGVVDDYFGSAYFGHGNFEDSGEGTIIGHVRGVCVYGCGGGGGGDEGSITTVVEGGAGEEDDVGEAVRSEEAGDVRADHGSGANDKDGSCRYHDNETQEVYRTLVQML